mmetsp:Transcript_14806/g.14394  ORF Transcript_14806/g.14394 Transcript_14806/m.14394 type:complete len:128 (-) Transcript_14806:957-1340(-)
MVAGAVLNANIFGNLAIIISELKRKEQSFQEQIDVANTTMKDMDLSKEIQMKVKKYLLTTQHTLDSQEEWDDFFALISPSLKREVIAHIFMNILRTNESFSQFDIILEFLVGNLEIVMYLPESNIIL